MEASRGPHAGQGGSVLTMDSIRAQYPPDKYILLLPAVSKTILDSRPMWALDVVEVKIDPDDKALVYALKSRKSGNNWIPEIVALQKTALDLISAAAEVQVMARRTDDRTNPLYAEYTAAAAMNTPSGTIRGQARTAEWDGDLERDKTRADAEKYVDNAIDKEWAGFKGLSAQARAKAIEDRFAAEWLREREFGKRKTESKAANRALRAMLALPSKYNYDDLKQRSFAIAKFVFAPDLDDPQVKLLVVNAGLQAQRQLFGGALAQAVGGELVPQLSAPSAPSPLALPAAGGLRDDDTLDMFTDPAPTAGGSSLQTPLASVAPGPVPPPPESSAPPPPPAAVDPHGISAIMTRIQCAATMDALMSIWNADYPHAEKGDFLAQFKVAWQTRRTEIAAKGGA